MVKKAAQAIPNQLLRRARLERGWTQRVVAERIGAPNDMMVTRWERGTAFPSAYYIERLCQLFEQKASELGLLPEPSTFEPSPPVFGLGSELVPQVASVDPVPAPAAALLLDPAIPQVSRNGDRIVGRAGLLQQLKHLLAEAGGGTAIALHGLPGVGKTTLAATLVADLFVQECFPAGILWAGLGPASNIQGVLARWAALLGVPVMQSGSPGCHAGFAGDTGYALGQGLARVERASTLYAAPDGQRVRTTTAAGRNPPEALCGLHGRLPPQATA